MKNRSKQSSRIIEFVSLFLLSFVLINSTYFLPLNLTSFSIYNRAWEGFNIPLLVIYTIILLLVYLFLKRERLPLKVILTRFTVIFLGGSMLLLITLASHSYNVLSGYLKAVSSSSKVKFERVESLVIDHSSDILSPNTALIQTHVFLDDKEIDSTHSYCLEATDSSGKTISRCGLYSNKIDGYSFDLDAGFVCTDKIAKIELTYMSFHESRYERTIETNNEITNNYNQTLNEFWSKYSVNCSDYPFLNIEKKTTPQ